MVATALTGPAAAVAEAAPTTQAHELGWACISVSDTRIVQVSSYNKDAPQLSTWVSGDRLHVELEGDGPQGRVCIPVITSLGSAALPDNTLIFEREVVRDGSVRPAIAELVLAPKPENLSEATLQVTGRARQWTQHDGVWTFQAEAHARFGLRAWRGLIGLGDGPPPAEVFRTAAAMQHFAEPCQPVRLTLDTTGYIGVYNRTRRDVSPRGVEPFRLRTGEVLSRCDGLSTDGMLVAVAKHVPGADASWFMIPRESPMERVGDADYSVERPLGGYHICRQPLWSTALLNETPLAGLWELLPHGEWRWLEADADAAPTLGAGTRATLLDHREGWALVRVVAAGIPRTIALPGIAVAMPSGPSSEARSLRGGLCQWPKGQWRATSSKTQAFRVAQDTPGAELAGLWQELQEGTRVLVLCQGRKGCDPITVGGAQSQETDRVVLVRYAGHLLGVKAQDLRDRVTGTFDTRRERPVLATGRSDLIAARAPAWALGIGPGARVSFLRKDDHAWTLRLRLQELDPDYGFEGALAAGGDGIGGFLSLQSGVGRRFAFWESVDLELRAGLLGKLDLRFNQGGGLGVHLDAKVQLRWVNDIAPLSFETGVSVGFGGTFGGPGRSVAAFGVPFWLSVELVQF